MKLFNLNVPIINHEINFKKLIELIVKIKKKLRIE